VLGIIGSSSASYDVTRGVPHYDFALETVKKFTPGLNDLINLGTSHRDTVQPGSRALNDTQSKGINGAGFMGEEVNPSSGRLEGSGNGQGTGSYDGDSKSGLVVERLQQWSK